MFEIAIGIILGVALFLIIQLIFKGAIQIDLENFDYENQDQIRSRFRNTSENSIG